MSIQDRIKENFNRNKGSVVLLALGLIYYAFVSRSTLITFLLAIGLAGILLKKINKPREVGLVAKEAKGFFAPIIESKNLPVIPVDNINLQPDERCYFVENGVSLWQERTARLSKGMGASGRLMRGFWIHSYGSKSTPLPQMQKIDTGDLFITNKRLIYLGKLYNRGVPLEDVLATHQYPDGILITHSGSQCNDFFQVRNCYIVRGIMSLAPNGDNLVNAKDMKLDFVVNDGKTEQSSQKSLP